MALLHVDATISPTKAEVVSIWLQGQTWCPADPNDLEMLGSYRFDDPAGEVGVETMVARLADGSVLQLPLTYRNAPLPGADAFLICTMSHSVLGDRSVYEAAGDPVFAAATVTAIVTGAEQAALQLEVEGELKTRDPAVTATGSGAAGAEVGGVEWIGAEVGRPHTVVHTSAGDLSVPHLLEAFDGSVGSGVLTGRYPGRDDEVLLARLG